MSFSGKPMKVIQCSCEHEFQDRRFGKNMRLMNAIKPDKGYRCTVCLAIRYSSGSIIESKKAKK
jgi:hypothetical protein